MRRVLVGALVCALLVPASSVFAATGAGSASIAGAARSAAGKVTANTTVQLRDPQTGGMTTMMLDERSGSFSPVLQLSGDRAAQLIRGLHDGSRGGALWQVLVFVCGVLPTGFVITGVMIWLRSRRRPQPATHATPAMAMPQVEAAE